MKRIIDYVNVFQGTRASVEPKPNTLSFLWNSFKGKAGNTSPSACLPFGSVSCSPYSGGYSSGYGAFKRNGGESPKTFFEGDKLIGFSHFTHSGSGAFGFYYNYLVTVPHLEKTDDLFALKEIDNERASVGYYACRFVKENIQAEVTVSDKVAIHRYTSLSNKPLKIAVDVSNDGLNQPWDDKVFAFSSESELKVENDCVHGYVTMQGVKLYFCIACKGDAKLWLDGNEIADKTLRLTKTDKKFGCSFGASDTVAIVKIGFSLTSEDCACKNAKNACDFDTARLKAECEWEKRLSTIELFGVGERDKEIFYSNYYHSLVKPCRWKNESFLWQEDGDFYLDFATLWDVYKTQIPLLFTLHEDVGRGIVKTLIRYGKEKGKLFNSLLMSSNMNIESTQACCLGCYVLYDAFIHNLIEKEDIDDVFAVVKSEIGEYEKGIKDGSFEKTTKLLDCTIISCSFASLAKRLGREKDYEYFSKIATYWQNAFGLDGLLKDGYPYYEGNRWNYSFRPVHDTERRIELGGGKEQLVEALDKFFAFDTSGDTGNRFEGFNNETDMETPYFYHYVGRYDRLISLIDECVNECFKEGRDGLPGNNDSGGLSACYLWNFIGIFPAIGHDYMFVGYPKATKTTLHLRKGKDLIITSLISYGKVTKITFNGKEIKGYAIELSTLMEGGELVFS